MDDGHPVPEPVSVALNCGMQSSKSVHTDLKGYFEFSLGTGAQANDDFSASNNSSVQSRGGSSFGGLLPPNVGATDDSLTGCELRVTVPGYRPLDQTITKEIDLGRVDVGTLQLTRIAGVQGSAISVTSLLVPEAARKEFDKGEKEARANHIKPAEEHMEKAVSEYANYAAAWNELGRMYAADHESEKADQAFEKAIAADPKYIPAFLDLANFDLQGGKSDGAVDAAGKALDLDPGNGFAELVLAMGDFNLGRFDDAEKSAKQLEKQPHASFPQLHALLAEIYLRQQNSANAAMEIRAYLKESPKGEFASQMQDHLQQIDKSLADAGADSSASGAPPAQPPIAP
jgi:tetratricopeptide (TPR) repeat protein